jgi:acetyl-CoA acetyltransferase
VCITGIGRSATGRALGADPVTLAVDACIAAVEDAGLTKHDIDGMAAFAPDLGAATAADVQDALGLEVDWFLGTAEGGPSQLAALWAAASAVALGQCTHAVAFHASCEGSVRARLGRGGSVPGTARAMPARAEGPQTWWMPYAAPSPANLIAMYAQRHFHDHGTTREQLGSLAVAQRAHAARNPAALFRDPLTLDEYLQSRMISEPLCLFDCDAPMDFGSAVVVSRADSLSGLRPAALDLVTFTTARRSRPSWDQGPDLSRMAALDDAGRALWRRTDLRPADVDVAGIYDGFSFIALLWLEALGFCAIGEGGPFLAGGQRFALDGDLPMNTDGGQLSAGRMHGWGYLAEVTHQLRGEAGPRQVPKSPEVGLVACGGGTIGSAAVLTRHR